MSGTLTGCACAVGTDGTRLGSKRDVQWNIGILRMNSLNVTTSDTSVISTKHGEDASISIDIVLIADHNTQSPDKASWHTVL